MLNTGMGQLEIALFIGGIDILASVKKNKLDDYESWRHSNPAILGAGVLLGQISC